MTSRIQNATRENIFYVKEQALRRPIFLKREAVIFFCSYLTFFAGKPLHVEGKLSLHFFSLALFLMASRRLHDEGN